jgi:hypothetical protein
LDDAIINIELLENTETIATNEQINLSTSLCKLYKTEEESNILWIIIGD